MSTFTTWPGDVMVSVWRPDVSAGGQQSNPPTEDGGSSEAGIDSTSQDQQRGAAHPASVATSPAAPGSATGGPTDG